MKTLNTDVVVIGGGATGAGVLRDLAMRGYDAVLLERADLAQGTSGRFHGLLHSGGRYVVSDPQSATECAKENEILRRLHPDAIEGTGGLFVVAPVDDEEYAAGFGAAAAAAGVPAEEISIAEALKAEPRLHPRIKRAFRVADGAVDGWRMVWGTVENAKEHGAQVYTYHTVTHIEVDGGQVVAVDATNEKTGDLLRVHCNGVINAGGPWAGKIAKLAGCHGVDVVPGSGIMVAMNHRLVNHVVNRCIKPGDGDIIVPAHTVSIIGTTDVRAEDPDMLPIPPADVQKMLDAGEELIPGFRQSRAVHTWAGARPLVKDSRVSSSDTRHMSRGMSIIDHLKRDGVAGLFTIVGGKLTTYRLMAEKVVDAFCAQRAEQRPCTTVEEPTTSAPSGTLPIPNRLAQREEDRLTDPVVCECELVTRSMITEVLAAQPNANLDDVRRQTRLGMGPCQGTFCGMRAAAMFPDANPALLPLFYKNRAFGLSPLMYGQQLREAILNRWVLDGALDLAHLPVPSPTEARATGDLALSKGLSQFNNEDLAGQETGADR